MSVTCVCNVGIHHHYYCRQNNIGLVVTMQKMVLEVMTSQGQMYPTLELLTGKTESVIPACIMYVAVIMHW